jgi:hypothetical protein
VKFMGKQCQQPDIEYSNHEVDLHTPSIWSAYGADGEKGSIF